MVNMRLSVFKRTCMALVSVMSLLALVVVPSGSVAAQSNADSLARHAYNLKYVALGDSVAAGLGLPLAAGATAEDTACGRAPQAYSSTVAAGIKAKLHNTKLQLTHTNTACQGAVVSNLTQPQTISALTVQPQLDKAFTGGTPHLISLTIGANDVHWADFIGACFSAANCDTAANTTAAHAYLSSMQSQLASTLSDIRNRGNSYIPPITVVTGYYNPISTQCINPNFTAGEVNWLTNITADFNTALKTTTENAGWFTAFAPIDFTGHDICSAAPWIQRPGVPGEPAPFHPNALGQEAMGKSVLNALGL